ncbi:MAG: DUF4388 domain-containing protein [Thermoanaerobaculia bacterium]|nr:DUF4388 domain-containing protein [Thermoanaerobaculia bacterium]
MTVAVGESVVAFAAVERELRPPGRPKPLLAGALEVFSVFEVLEVLGFLKRSGTVVFTAAGGERARCWLEDGQILGAEYRHRRGPEALLSVLDWREGEFAYESTEAASPPAGPPFSAASVMLEAMRLEDELERRRELVPAPQQRLFLSSERHCPDAVGCGLSSLLADLRTRPGMTVTEFEAQSDLCPAKVRLGLAQLAYCQILAPPKLGLQPATEPVALAACFRVLVALDGAVLATAVPQLLTQLGRHLGAPAVTSNGPSQGPTFARFRPGGGSVLSVSFVGIAREQRLLFESFAGSVDLVLLDAEGSEEARRWFAGLPAHAHAVTVGGPQEVTAVLLRQLPPSAAPPPS